MSETFKDEGFKVFMHPHSTWQIIFYHMLQEFSRKLMAFEKIISSSAHGDGLGIRRFMGFEREYSHLGDLAHALRANEEVAMTSLSTKSKSVLSMLLLAYRMIDIAAALESHPELPIKVEREGSFGICGEVLSLSLISN